MEVDEDLDVDQVDNHQIQVDSQPSRSSATANVTASPQTSQSIAGAKTQASPRTDLSQELLL